LCGRDDRKDKIRITEKKKMRFVRKKSAYLLSPKQGASPSNDRGKKKGDPLLRFWKKTRSTGKIEKEKESKKDVVGKGKKKVPRGQKTACEQKRAKTDDGVSDAEGGSTTRQLGANLGRGGEGKKKKKPQPFSGGKEKKKKREGEKRPDKPGGGEKNPIFGNQPKKVESFLSEKGENENETRQAGGNSSHRESEKASASKKKNFPPFLPNIKALEMRERKRGEVLGISTRKKKGTVAPRGDDECGPKRDRETPMKTVYCGKRGDCLKRTLKADKGWSAEGNLLMPKGRESFVNVHREKG